MASFGLASYLFDPHQFALADFVIDYRSIPFPAFKYALEPPLIQMHYLENSCVGCHQATLSHMTIPGADIAVCPGP